MKILAQRPTHISAVAAVLLITKTFTVKYYGRRQRQTDRQTQKDRDRQRQKQTESKLWLNE